MSRQLVRQGFDVTAVEPLGSGFSSFARVQGIVLKGAAAFACAPALVAATAESLDYDATFDFAYSVNVMEHVNDAGVALRRIGAALRPGAVYRFMCPNYTFPYEPHFNIPILFTKRWTERAFRARIFSSKQVEDQAATWRSLNWITVGTVRSVIASLPELRASFRRSLVCDMLERLGRDPEFAARRSRWMVQIARWVVGLGLHRVLALLPARLQPVIDCCIERGACPGASQ